MPSVVYMHSNVPVNGDGPCSNAAWEAASGEGKQQCKTIKII